MFCPKCSAYLTERDLIKTEVKYAPGNVPIEYQATCPQCRVDMGRVSWGQLTVNPDIEKKSEEPAQAAQPAQPEKAEDTSAHSKICPHCGKPLPAGF